MLTASTTRKCPADALLFWSWLQTGLVLKVRSEVRGLRRSTGLPRFWRMPVVFVIVFVTAAVVMNAPALPELLVSVVVVVVTSHDMKCVE